MFVPDKRKMLENAIREFMANENSETMMELLITTFSVTKQGSGLLWSDVKEVVENCYNANKPEISSL